MISGMAAEINEITDSDRQLLEHILADVHAVAQTQARHDRLLRKFEPLLDAFLDGGVSYMSMRRARKAGQG
jgi:predicted component of type VI protein secretion system